MASPDPSDDRPRYDRDRDRDREPADDPNEPTHISEVPWFRRNRFCSTVLGLHLLVVFFSLCIPVVSLLGLPTTFGVIAVCVIVLTGPVYFAQRKKDGTLKQWSKGNKVAAVILLVLFVVGYAAVVALVVYSSRLSDELNRRAQNEPVRHGTCLSTLGSRQSHHPSPVSA